MSDTSKNESKPEPEVKLTAKEKALREQFAEAIAEAEKNGQKWSITPAGHLRVDL